MANETHTLAGLKFVNVHSFEKCTPEICIFHNPTNHPMRNWEPYIRETGLIERLCEHGVGHPDPDSSAWFDRAMNHPSGTWDIHGCDGCCKSILK